MERRLGKVWDVAIAGGGATGLTLALALRRLTGGALRVVLIDRGDPALRSGPRTSALAEGPRRMLARLDAWEGLRDLAQPMRAMEISDSRLADAVKSTMLRFAGDESDPVAHMLFHSDLEPFLFSRAKAEGLDVRSGVIEAAEFGAGSAVLHVSGGEAIPARLVVGADGLRSKVRTAARIPVVAWPYDRTALVMTVRHEEDHEGVAIQHFLEGGPFASLPVTGKRSSIVWTEPTALAASYRELPKDRLVDEIDRRLGARFGEIEIEDGPESFPLVLQLARRFAGPRLALVGDAAHRVHPLAGQGLNIGLRDVATLAELIVDQVRLGLDPGAEDVLGEYETRRRFDATASAAAFDFLHRAYDVKGPAARAVRTIGMAATERFAGLKTVLRREASGTLGATPALFR